MLRLPLSPAIFFVHFPLFPIFFYISLWRQAAIQFCFSIYCLKVPYHAGLGFTRHQLSHGRTHGIVLLSLQRTIEGLIRTFLIVDMSAQAELSMMATRRRPVRTKFRQCRHAWPVAAFVSTTTSLFFFKALQSFHSRIRFGFCATEFSEEVDWGHFRTAGTIVFGGVCILSLSLRSYPQP